MLRRPLSLELSPRGGLIDGESTAAYGIDGVTPGQSATTVVKQGTYGVLTVTIADGTFSYVMNSTSIAQVIIMQY